MSRLDPVRERHEYLDAIQAERERREGARLGSPEQSRNPIASNSARSVERAPEPPRPEVARDAVRRPLYNRDQGYRLSQSEIRALVDLGKFRVIGTEDLERHAYGGRRNDMQSDLANLLRQGLVRKGIFDGPEKNTPRELLTLTKRGHRLVRANRLVTPDQAIYWGFVKPREANHDADLYKLYNTEAARIVKEGGQSPRVILDFELKRKISRDLARLGPQGRPEIAHTHGLRVMRGKIPIPDLRVEYEKPSGETARVDLELVTEHYRGRSLADKVKAGFALYTSRGDADRLRRILDRQELTAEILSL